MTALLWAADMGHLQVLELLLHSGADMTLVDDNGLTALLWAADRGHVDCVKALLDAGIDVNIVDKVRAVTRFLFTALFFLRNLLAMMKFSNLCFWQPCGFATLSFS